MTLLDKRSEPTSPSNFSACATAVVVDDDPHVRSVLTRIFESAGYATDAFDNGAEGARAALAIRPDLVTMDLTLPGMDGIEAIRRIRSAGSSAHIIVISGLHDDADKVSAFDAGADDYVTKPFRSRELRARIDAVTRRLNR
ncbi:response regulator transcription factor [Microbacterium testaceum]|uniref:response regulator transcription factor n=1 Tax=Microbacterium testaceum TaxID=2033 RepID=UPI0025AF0D73|nr:response regulator transcription factor [Microbacterium testaceum]WJS91208.1 response regulator transcription factor [Microbacterium testaceum]